MDGTRVLSDAEEKALGRSLRRSAKVVHKAVSPNQLFEEIKEEYKRALPAWADTSDASAFRLVGDAMAIAVSIALARHLSDAV
jgi:hypothetical protein